jgi:hypothetical protein
MILLNQNLLLPIESPSLILLLLEFVHRVKIIVYFDIINAFDIIPNELHVHRFNNYGLSTGYFYCFCSYLTIEYIYMNAMLSLPLGVLSGVPQESASGACAF